MAKSGNHHAHEALNMMTPQLSEPTIGRLTECEGWTLHEFSCLSSTNTEARRVPAWHAVRADVQTGGYGRTGRAWVSNEGGLWISAVLPAPGSLARWATLPLAAGWAVIEALACIGVEGLRLRWPNDIMAGQRKLAGLLVERFQPDTVVIGIGLNVFNRPGEIDGSLDGRTVSLIELMPGGYGLGDITRLLLRAFRNVHRLLEQNCFSDIAEQITARWTAPARVELTLNGPRETFCGRFNGIDPDGRLWLSSLDGVPTAFAASEVALLRELEEQPVSVVQTPKPVSSRSP